MAGMLKAEVRVDLDCLTSWVMLQLQPARRKNFPAVCDSMHSAEDGQLATSGRRCFLATKLVARHYRGAHDPLWTSVS